MLHCHNLLINRYMKWKVFLNHMSWKTGRSFKCAQVAWITSELQVPEQLGSKTMTKWQKVQLRTETGCQENQGFFTQAFCVRYYW